MSLIRTYFRDLFSTTAANWNRFWFTPADPATLGLLRILAGAMIFYTHLVWTLDLAAFFGPQSWLDHDVVSLMQRGGWQWSHFWWSNSPAWLWSTHIVALVVCLMFTLGIWTRLTSILTCLITLSYAHRAPDAMFGLDQINGFLSLYLAIGPSGAAYSLDRWLASRKTGLPLTPARPSIAANIAIRLIQWQMCVLYLFAGLSKLQGPAWWDGTAFWGAVANLEYQSVDMVWLVHFPWLVNILTHVTIAWELSYIVLIWGRLSRPLMLAVAIPIHLGIGICLGMMTFGSVMLIANVAFISPVLVRLLLDSRRNKQSASDLRHALTGPNWAKTSHRATANR
ncbi:MAG: hypothetical protein JWM11_2081 [Planctomycetaceae bacterium]|nr:hypothetical protein [Planctomycetaceae bacterium]